MTIDGYLIGLVGLILTLLGAVAGAAAQHGVSKEKVRSLELRMSAAEARQDLIRDQLARGDTAFEGMRKDFGSMNNTLVDIKADLERLLARG